MNVAHRAGNKRNVRFWRPLDDSFFKRECRTVAITQKQLEDVAHLARLGVDEKALSDLAGDVNQILGHAQLLADDRLDRLEPMAHPLDQSQYLRPDAVTEANQREQLMAAAPARDQGLFLVPKVIE